MNIFVLGWMQEGDPRVLRFFQELKDELKYRVDNKIGVIPEEKYRLLWGSGLPPWHTMNIFNYFESLGAVFVGETCYKPPYVADIPDSVSDPLERMALVLYYAQLEKHKRSVVGGYNFVVYENPLEWIEEYQADGVVFHWLRSCRGTTIGQLYYQKLIAGRSAIPTLFLESDMCDVRDFFEADWKAKIGAFIDMVATYKRHRG
jgi:benzoyl-CoA reductase/2-hydroxyglutaryl-CoA dehydratase subunit BcrC/BadD/HgdB